MSQSGSEPSSWIYPRLSPVDEAADGLGARLDTRRAEQEIRERLRDWQGLLVRQTTEARDILRTFLVGRLTFTPVPDEHRYELTGEGTFERLLGVDNRSTAVVTPAGFEPAISTLKGSRPWPG